MDRVCREVLSFLRRHRQGDQPLLLGLSGGADSMVLFHVLSKLAVPFHVAHVDHRFRPESAQEAEKLKERVEAQGVPYHLLVLEGELAVEGEDQARQARLGFFRDLCIRHRLQATILGHHRDDHAETVLKRLLEGARLARLRGLRPVTALDGVVVWRPLLDVSKSQILSYADMHGLDYFEDATNFDGSNLRSRFRTSLMPELTRHLGKRVEAPLVRLGREAQELEEFMEGHLHALLGSAVCDSTGWSLDFSGYPGLSIFETRYVVRALLDRGRVGLAWDKVDQVVRGVREGQDSLRVVQGGVEVTLQGGCLRVKS